MKRLLKTPPETDVAADFNAAAKQYLAEEIQDRLLLARFGLLMKFRAKDNDEKDRLCEALFSCAEQYLEKYAAAARDYISDREKAAAGALLSALAAPENAPFLPRKAPAALADLGLVFVRQAETAQSERDRDDMTDFAVLCLENAERFRAVIEKRDEDITTSKPITPAKRLVLKPKDDGPQKP